MLVRKLYYCLFSTNILYIITMQLKLKIAMCVIDIILFIVNKTCDIVEYLTGHVVFSVKPDDMRKMLTPRHKTYLEDKKICNNFQNVLSVLYRTDLTPCGRAAIRQQVLLALENGCYFQDAANNAAKTGNVRQMKCPIILIGMARTGTTLLNNLLAVDQQFYSPSFTDMSPTKRLPNLVSLFVFARLLLDLLHIHDDTDLTTPEEISTALLGMFILAPSRVGSFGNDYHERYIKSLDYSTVKYFYAKVKTWLEYMADKHHPGHERVVIKHHVNLLDIRAMVEVFPGAVFVNTLRDPKQLIPSMCSFSNTMANNYIRNPTEKKRNIGESVFELSSRKANEYVQFRKDFSNKNHKAVFLDVQYADLVKEPMKTVSSIYQAAGMELSSSVKNKMEKYLASNKQHKHGVHSYSLQEYGLDDQMVEEAFKTYMDFHHQ